MRSDLQTPESNLANSLAVASDGGFVRKQYDRESSGLLERLEESVAEFSRVIKGFTGDRQLDYCRVSAAVRHLCCSIRLTELSGVSRENVRTIVEPAREIHSLSPFISRIQRWPRNYMGDFETIEYLCSGVSRAAPKSTGELLEHLALNCVVAQQHRNKVSWAAEQALRATIKKSGKRK